MGGQVISYVPGHVIESQSNLHLQVSLPDPLLPSSSHSVRGGEHRRLFKNLSLMFHFPRMGKAKTCVSFFTTLPCLFKGVLHLDVNEIRNDFMKKLEGETKT